MTRTEPLHCYACGHQYWYLGRDLHPGQCPQCASHCVSPAGEVTALVSVDVSAETVPREVTVLAIDDRCRHLRYRLRCAERTIELMTVEADGQIVRPTADGTAPPIPGPIRNHVTQQTIPAQFRQRERGWSDESDSIGRGCGQSRP